jgi:peroxiredoxin
VSPTRSVPVPIGSAAPDFTAQDEKGGEFRFSEALLGGPILLIFYPADWGFICRNEIVEFRDRQAAFEVMGVRLIGYSTNMVISHAVWSDNLRLKFTLLSDPPGDVAAAFGVLDLAEESFNKGRTKRALFLVDRAMRVIYSWLSEDPWLEPDYEQVEAACREALRQCPVQSVRPTAIESE